MHKSAIPSDNNEALVASSTGFFISATGHLGQSVEWSNGRMNNSPMPTVHSHVISSIVFCLPCMQRGSACLFWVRLWISIEVCVCVWLCLSTRLRLA